MFRFVLALNILCAASLTLTVSDIDKFQIENNLNSKITNVISNFYSKDNFAVTSNVLLISSNNISANSSIQSFGALELEGILPAVPQGTTDGTIQEENNYKIQIQDITVWLDYELDVINAQQNIKKFLFESIDWLANCDNCLKFRSKAFSGGNTLDSRTTPSNNMNSDNITTEDDLRILEDNIAYLTEQIEKYEENNSTEKNQWMIDFLNQALQEEKELNANLSDQIIENARNVQKRDSSIIMKTLKTSLKENSRSLIEGLNQGQYNKYNQWNINAGPMVGYSEKSEVALWIQTKKASKVKFIYWDINNLDNILETEEITTNKKSGFTATLIADLVKPGTTYYYQPIIDNQKIKFDYKLEFQTQEHWEYRTPPPNFSFAVGSCAYTNEIEKDRPGKSYGGDYFIYSNILEKDPDFMLWLGDNVYFREPDASRTGVYHRYSHDRALKELQPLLGSVHHYAIWDDHDYGPNNSDRSFIHKNITLQAFKDFWANPSYGIENNGGITTQFRWSDVDFFLLDNRFFRSPQNRQHTYKEILGKEQLEWLIDALSASQATFKIVAIGGQVLNSEKIFENYINWEEEHTELLNLIEKEQIEGVVFLSGDRHFSEVSKISRFNSYPLHDFTVSPLTSGFCDICVDENNKNRIKESAVFQRNFAIFSIYSSDKDRVLDYTIFDNKGKPLWNYKINASDLKY